MTSASRCLAASRTAAMTSGPPESAMAARRTSTGISLPSLRRPVNRCPAPMGPVDGSAA